MTASPGLLLGNSNISPPGDGSGVATGSTTGAEAEAGIVGLVIVDVMIIV